MYCTVRSTYHAYIEFGESGTRNVLAFLYVVRETCLTNLELRMGIHTLCGYSGVSFKLHSSYAITRPPFVWHIRAGWAFYSEDSSKLPQRRKQVPECIRPNLTWSDNERGRERTPMAGGETLQDADEDATTCAGRGTGGQGNGDKAFPWD